MIHICQIIPKSADPKYSSLCNLEMHFSFMRPSSARDRYYLVDSFMPFIFYTFNKRLIIYNKNVIL